jgi:hypothetical protein
VGGAGPKGVVAPDAKRLRELEAENAKLKLPRDRADQRLSARRKRYEHLAFLLFQSLYLAAQTE